MASDRSTAEDLARDTTSQAEATASAHPIGMKAAPLKREVDRTASPFGAAEARARAASLALDPAARRARKAYEGLNASSIGLEFGIAVIIGLVAGYYGDKALGSTPWLMLLGMCFGLAAGFRGVLRYVRKSDRQAEREDREAKEDARG